VEKTQVIVQAESGEYVIDMEEHECGYWSGTCKKMLNLLLWEKSAALVEKKAPMLIDFLVDVHKKREG